MLRELQKYLDKYAERGVTENDFQDAACALRQHQFLWSDRHGQGKHYDLIVLCQDYFEALFSAFGDDFFIDRQFAYCGILPKNARPSMSLLPTVFLLILAKLHDAESRKACTEMGRSKPSPEILIDAFIELTGRDKPKKTEAIAALKLLHAQGVIQLGEIQESELPEITVMPSIMRVVGLQHVEALKMFATNLGAEEIEDTSAVCTPAAIDEIPADEVPGNA